MHPCQFPVALVERLLLALTNEGDLVVDPYIGVGTTAVAGLFRNRRSAGADTEERYLRIAGERLQQAAQGTLPVPPLDMPVYRPTGNEAVARMPEEWTEGESQASGSRDLMADVSAMGRTLGSEVAPWTGNSLHLLLSLDW